ncbi:MAG: hypothetical protein QOF18_1107 [Frankiaceae bacterium]|nr:hypothetical protein [Frankiaceae bacterium]
MQLTRRHSALLAAGAVLALTAGSAAATTGHAAPALTTRQHSTWISGQKAFLWPQGHKEVGAESVPTPNDANNLIFHGGAVQHSPKVYLIFWGTEWKSGFKVGPGYTQKTAINYESKFFANVGGSPFAGVQTQFCDGITAGSTSCKGVAGAKFVKNPRRILHGVWVDPSPAPATITSYGLAENISTDPIATEAVRAASHFQTHDIDALFMIFTPPGHAATAYGSVYCAYHSEVTNPPLNHGIRYAFMPFTPEQGAGCGGNSVNGRNDSFGHGYFDSYTLAGGHEWAEAVTDPDAWPTQDGWNDVSTSENGDKCAYHFTKNIRLGGYYFAVQPMWSNEANGGKGGCAFTRGTGTMPVPPPV